MIVDRARVERQNEQGIGMSLPQTEEGSLYHLYSDIMLPLLPSAPQEYSYSLNSQDLRHHATLL